MASPHQSVEIHPSAYVHPEAIVGEGTRVGAFSVIDGKVRIGKRCRIQEHVIIRDYTTLGDDVAVFPFCVLGSEPQHLKYAGEETTAVIGNRVVLREYVTVHRGTGLGGGVTSIGDDCFIMAYCHIAHDCHVGRNVIMANVVQLAGHVEIGDGVTISGLTGIPQFQRIGRLCFIGAGSMVRKDIPPFTVGKGNEFETQGINVVGLERKGFSPESIRILRKAYRALFLRKVTLAEAMTQLAAEFGDNAEVRELLSFIEQSKHGIVR